MPKTYSRGLPADVRTEVADSVSFIKQYKDQPLMIKFAYDMGLRDLGKKKIPASTYNAAKIVLDRAAARAYAGAGDYNAARELFERVGDTKAAANITKHTKKAEEQHRAYLQKSAEAERKMGMDLMKQGETRLAISRFVDAVGIYNKLGDTQNAKAMGEIAYRLGVFEQRYGAGSSNFSPKGQAKRYLNKTRSRLNSLAFRMNYSLEGRSTRRKELAAIAVEARNAIRSYEKTGMLKEAEELRYALKASRAMEELGTLVKSSGEEKVVKRRK